MFILLNFVEGQFFTAICCFARDNSRCASNQNLRSFSMGMPAASVWPKNYCKCPVSSQEESSNAHSQKKAAVIEPRSAFDHVGILVNEFPGSARPDIR
jgi:hypothetical protein